ncbi:MAG: hypothetical protein LBU92_03555 [Prevotellaceae bacterium]|jgi:hypothetical protein|nr:hypothetical protein [Prevotellaceae bacterium]
MLKLVKHISLVALCLLVICGAVGTHFYVFVCSNQHHATQLTLSENHHGCCAHDGEQHNAETERHSNVDGGCCSTTSQLLSVSSFNVSELSKLGKIAVQVMLFDACCTCNGECCHAPRATLASSFSYSPHSPNIYSYGQLRL